MPPQSPDWHALLKLATPMAGMIGAGGHGRNLAFQQAFQQSQQQIAAEKERKRLEGEQKRMAGGNYKLKIAEQLMGLDDPVQFQQLKELASGVGRDAYGLGDEDFAGLSFPQSKTAEKRLKELTDQLDRLDKQGYNADDLAESGAQLELKDGSRIPIRSAMELTQRRPMVNGAPVPRPPKPNAVNPGSFEDYVARYASARKKTVAQLTDLDLEDARRRFQQADDHAPRPVTQPRDRYQVQSVTNADGSTSLVRVNLETRQAEPIGMPSGVIGAGKPTESEQKSGAYLDRITASDTKAKSFESTLGSLGAQLDARLPNLLASQQGQLYRQAQDEFINAGLRDESGAAIQPSEYERYRKIYFATAGDTPATIRQKQDARARVITGLRRRAGNVGIKNDPAASARQKLADR